MTETQAAHVWRVLLELNGLKDFEVKIRQAPEKKTEEQAKEAIA